MPDSIVYIILLFMKKAAVVATVFFMLLPCVFAKETQASGVFQRHAEVPFMSGFEAIHAVVTDYAYKDAVPSSFALIRMPNGKITFMTRQDGVMSPFYIRAVETGYWDTRYDPDTDYDRVFTDMKSLGANTAYVMLHWEDIEPSDGMFDFSFPDMVEAAAFRQGLKINWILFLHAQKNGVPSHSCDTAWTFHLDDRDSCNYTMQWPEKNGIVYKNIKALIDNDGIRPLHVYGHPEIFWRIKRMLYTLACHYRDSDTVIGVQLGNEEGFSFLDKSDFNPVTAALYEEWKLKTNKTDYAQFKKEAMNWWWRQFTTAYHLGDPYKFLSFNLDAAQAEAGDPERMAMTGTSASTYADGNLDAIGTMFYKQWGYKAILGLDARYNEGSYCRSLPLLVPSEIGIGGFNTAWDFNSFVLHTLERGAQGFGVYCYGEVKDDFETREILRSVFGNISLVQDVVHAGLPGPGDIACSTDREGFKVSHLNAGDIGSLAFVWASSFLNDGPAPEKGNLPLTFTASKEGRYELVFCSEGEKQFSREFRLKSGETAKTVLHNISGEDSVFILILRR